MGGTAAARQVWALTPTVSAPGALLFPQSYSTQHPHSIVSKWQGQEGILDQPNLHGEKLRFRRTNDLLGST